MAAHAPPEPCPASAPLPKHLNDRLFENDPALVRIEVTSSVLSEFTKWELNDFPRLLTNNQIISTVHLSGDDLEDTLTNDQIEDLLTAVSRIPNLQELFVFRGECELMTGARLAKMIQQAPKLTVFMIWGFSELSHEPKLAGAMRMHPSLERITVTLPRQQPYAGLDVFAMGWAGMSRLKCLSIRCQPGQKDAIFSPEAIMILMNSTSIQSMYLEGCALTDDHSDVIAEQLKKPNNKTLKLLDLKHNMFSDDALYSFAACLRTNNTLTSLDLSGVDITEEGVNALADAMHENSTLLNLELEGVLSRYQDEFDIPEGHSNTSYMQALNFQLRLNRAGSDESRPLFVEALNMVSDHLGCLYHLVRKNPGYCSRQLTRMPMVRYAVPKLISPAEAQEAPELSEPVKRMFQSYAMH